jgi:hypothetical protein
VNRWRAPASSDDSPFPPPRHRGYNRGRMAILFPALGMAFAALCVWLTVRIINGSKIWAIELGIYFLAIFWLAAFLSLDLSGDRLP